MIHFTCDLCKQPLEASDDLRYVVQIEIYAALDPAVGQDDDCDHLEELHDILERVRDLESPQFGDDVCQKLRFDLCPECRKRFLKNPLGRVTTEQFDFSNN